MRNDNSSRPSPVVPRRSRVVLSSLHARRSITRAHSPRVGVVRALFTCVAVTDIVGHAVDCGESRTRKPKRHRSVALGGAITLLCCEGSASFSSDYFACRLIASTDAHRRHCSSRYCLLCFFSPTERASSYVLALVISRAEET